LVRGCRALIRHFFPAHALTFSEGHLSSRKWTAASRQIGAESEKKFFQGKSRSSRSSKHNHISRYTQGSRFKQA
jgi:hypothetical protein